MTLGRLLVVVLLAAGLAACGRQAPPPAPQPAPPPVPPPAASAGAGGFGATEQAFVQLAISVGDQVLLLLDRGAARAGTPDLRDLAEDLAATRRTELAALRGLLAAESVPYRNLHEGHDMPGMPTDGELAALDAAAGFDREFTRLVRAHLAEWATVARSAAAQVTHPGTRTVAEGMAGERAAALERLAGPG